MLLYHLIIFSRQIINKLIYLLLINNYIWIPCCKNGINFRIKRLCNFNRGPVKPLVACKTSIKKIFFYERELKNTFVKKWRLKIH